MYNIAALLHGHAIKFCKYALLYPKKFYFTYFSLFSSFKIRIVSFFHLGLVFLFKLCNFFILIYDI